MPKITPYGQVGDAQSEWHPDMAIPRGGSLPKDTEDKSATVFIKPEPSIGCGTLQCPKVYWEKKAVYEQLVRKQQDVLQSSESFAQEAARRLGFPHIIIRKELHDAANTYAQTGRGQTRRTKTGIEPDQIHLTVYLANQPNWVCVHGHIYGVVRETSYKLMSERKSRYVKKVP
ncbi:hypothetical protein F4813DRAFT_367183 [Daldinia decipiens]|uniref:uncharacterized protein n=1 Tax=Daldinia decipiens TaxID=326647 RepID=UPI0020C4D6CE|nr:uncharacterized protein F4813DRAFT_367183 [Daldinia decipiens]KAI1655492.1 hypothetical protein F4813DRAFT_367183 [Daldinia decipiens]